MAKLSKEEKRIAREVGLISDKGSNSKNKKEKKYKNLHGFIAVDENYVLIKRNVFTGKIRTFDSGTRFVWPFYTGELMPVSDRQVDYAPKKFVSNDGIEVMLDVVVKFNISDAKKYKLAAENPESLLKSSIESLLSDYILSKTYDELCQSDAREFMSLPSFQSKFQQFEMQYGIHIQDLQGQNLIIANEAVRKQYEDAAAQKRENQSIVMHANAEAEKIRIEERARIELEEEKIRRVEMEKARTQATVNEMLINRMAQTVISLKQQFESAGMSVSMEELTRIAYTTMSMNSGNSNIQTHTFVNGLGGNFQNSGMIYNTGGMEQGPGMIFTQNTPLVQEEQNATSSVSPNIEESRGTEDIVKPQETPDSPLEPVAPSFPEIPAIEGIEEPSKTR